MDGYLETGGSIIDIDDFLNASKLMPGTDFAAASLSHVLGEQFAKANDPYTTLRGAHFAGMLAELDVMGANSMDSYRSDNSATFRYYYDNKIETYVFKIDNSNIVDRIEWKKGFVFYFYWFYRL